MQGECPGVDGAVAVYTAIKAGYHPVHTPGRVDLPDCGCLHSHFLSTWCMECAFL
jgi:hypothetical protein